MLLAENNIPRPFADKLNAILPCIFPDIKMAKEYKIGKTKASCILNESLSPHFLHQTIDIMKTDFYSLFTYGSNDTGLEKKNPLTVCIFDINASMVDTQLFNMRCTTGQTFLTAATMFQKIDDVMTKLRLAQSNSVGFSLDSTI